MRLSNLFFFKIILTIPSLCILIKLLESTCQFLLKKKKPDGILIGIAWNPYINLPGINISIILLLPGYEHGMSLYFLRPSLGLNLSQFCCVASTGEVVHASFQRLFLNTFFGNLKFHFLMICC